MIFDTHSHCYWETLLSGIDEVVANMQKNNVVKAVQIGCDIESSKKAIDLARRFPGIFYATIGHHPETAQDVVYDEKILGEFEKLVLDNRDLILAVGECGLDFHYLDGTDGGTCPIDLDHLSEKAITQIQAQKSWWLVQWRLAQKYDLPVVIHTRDARDATADFMIENGISRAVIHCFSETPEFAERLLDFSTEIYFAFGGILTYKKSEAVQATAKMLPLDRILLETDAPFLAPQAVRGQVCEPAFTRYTLEKLADIREEPIEILENAIYENSLRFYGLAG